MDGDFTGSPWALNGLPSVSLVPPTCTSQSQSSWCTRKPGRAWSGRWSSCTELPPSRCPQPAEAVHLLHHWHHWELYHGGSRYHFLTASAYLLGYWWKCGCWRVIPKKTNQTMKMNCCHCLCTWWRLFLNCPYTLGIEGLLKGPT